MNFGGKDLDTNRDGILSDGQRARIQRWDGCFTSVWWLMILCLASLMYINTLHIHSGLVSFGLFGMAMSFVGVAFWLQGKTRRALARNRVASIEGQVFRHRREVSSGKSSTIIWEIAVKDKTFSVSKSVYDAFFVNPVYRLYYVPELNELVSAEAFDFDKSKGQ